MTNALMHVSPKEYYDLVKEIVNLANAHQNHKKVVHQVNAQVKNRIHEINRKISAFEQILLNDQERFMTFQTSTFSMIEKLIESGEVDAALIMHERISDKFSTDPLKMIFDSYNNLMGNQYVTIDVN